MDIGAHIPSGTSDVWSIETDKEKYVHEENERLLSESEPTPVHSPYRWQSRSLTFANLLLFFSSLLMLLISLLRPTLFAQSSRRREISWSPVMDFVPAQTVRFNETFGFPTAAPSIFAGHPSKEVDEAWARFSHHPRMDGRIGRMTVPFSAIQKMEKSKNEKWAASVVEIVDGRYMASLELFHNTHCLDMFRQLIYPKHYKIDVMSKRGHLEHCLETVRQAIFCNSGTGLVTFHWVEGKEEPWPDYNVGHQCRDPEAMLKWALSNTVDNPREGIKKKGGETELQPHDLD